MSSYDFEAVAQSVCDEATNVHIRPGPCDCIRCEIASALRAAWQAGGKHWLERAIAQSVELHPDGIIGPLQVAGFGQCRDHYRDILRALLREVEGE